MLLRRARTPAIACCARRTAAVPRPPARPLSSPTPPQPPANLLEGGLAELQLVRAHPWFTDGTSNDEQDNSVTAAELFTGRHATPSLPLPSLLAA